MYSLIFWRDVPVRQKEGLFNTFCSFSSVFLHFIDSVYCICTCDCLKSRKPGLSEVTVSSCFVILDPCYLCCFFHLLQDLFLWFFVICAGLTEVTSLATHRAFFNFISRHVISLGFSPYCCTVTAILLHLFTVKFWLIVCSMFSLFVWLAVACCDETDWSHLFVGRCKLIKTWTEWRDWEIRWELFIDWINRRQASVVYVAVLVTPFILHAFFSYSILWW